MWRKIHIFAKVFFFHFFPPFSFFELEVSAGAEAEEAETTGREELSCFRSPESSSDRQIASLPALIKFRGVK